jgi:transcriptional regulator with XRE-family HTH domain
MATSIIALRLQQLRTDKGVTQDRAAEACDITRTALARYETGTRVPRIEIAAKLAEYYSVSVDYILGRESDPAPAPLTLHADMGDGETVVQNASPRDEAEAIRAALIAKLLRLNPDQLAMAENYVAFLEHQNEAEK